MYNDNLLRNTYTISFFGHRVVEDPLRVEQHLELLIRRVLMEKEYVEFLVGRNGEFDHLVSSTIRRCKREYRSDNSVHIWVLRYLTAEFRDNENSFREYNDEIEVCEAAVGSYYKNVHQTRNRALVDRSDIVIFCVQRESGGAWQTKKCAKKQNIPYINVNDLLNEF